MPKAYDKRVLVNKIIETVRKQGELSFAEVMLNYNVGLTFCYTLAYLVKEMAEDIEVKNRRFVLVKKDEEEN